LQDCDAHRDRRNRKKYPAFAVDKAKKSDEKKADEVRDAIAKAA
jgi:hypothetical protein